MATKQCSKCQTIKPLEDFAPDRKMASGRKSQCRECTRAAQRASRQSDEYRAKRRAYRKRPDVRAKESDYYRQWRGAAERVEVTEKTCTSCGETKTADGFSPNKKTRDGLASWCKVCVAGKTSTIRQRPEVKARNAEYARTAKVKTWRAVYRKTDLNRAAQARYNASDKGKVSRANKTARRRLREELAGAKITGRQWREILTENGNACFYCRRSFSEELRPTLDHKVPLARGGTHARENIVPACMHCNCSKRDGDCPVTLPDGTLARKDGAA